MEIEVVGYEYPRFGNEDRVFLIKSDLSQEELELNPPEVKEAIKKHVCEAIKEDDELFNLFAYQNIEVDDDFIDYLEVDVKYQLRGKELSKAIMNLDGEWSIRKVE